jgi:hypothetical protein
MSRKPVCMQVYRAFDPSFAAFRYKFDAVRYTDSAWARGWQASDYRLSSSPSDEVT